MQYPSVQRSFSPRQVNRSPNEIQSIRESPLYQQAKEQLSISKQRAQNSSTTWWGSDSTNSSAQNKQFRRASEEVYEHHDVREPFTTNNHNLKQIRRGSGGMHEHHVPRNSNNTLNNAHEFTKSRSSGSHERLSARSPIESADSESWMEYASSGTSQKYSRQLITGKHNLKSEIESKESHPSKYTLFLKKGSTSSFRAKREDSERPRRSSDTVGSAEIGKERVHHFSREKRRSSVTAHRQGESKHASSPTSRNRLSERNSTNFSSSYAIKPGLRRSSVHKATRIGAEYKSPYSQQYLRYSSLAKQTSFSKGRREVEAKDDDSNSESSGSEEEENTVFSRENENGSMRRGTTVHSPPQGSEHRGRSMGSTRVLNSSTDRYSSSTPRSEPRKSKVGLCCDKCDGSHNTSDCKWFKKSRDSHPDARRKKQPTIGSSSSQKPKVVPFTDARVVRQPGDGSCLFHSLAYGLGEQGGAYRLRGDIAAFIAKHPKLEIADTPLHEWVEMDSNCSVKSYTSRMARSGWGGGIECAGCSQLRKVNVHVYEIDRGRRAYKRISCFDYGKHCKTVNVLYQGRMHYDALVLNSSKSSL